MYCKLIGRQVTQFTPSVPLLFPPAPTPAGGVELKMSAYTLWYKNIYEGMLAFCTHTSIRYTIRIVPRNRPSRGQPLVSKHGLYQMWIAWMESMGVLYALGLSHLKSDRAFREKTECFIMTLLWTKCKALGINAFNGGHVDRHRCKLELTPVDLNE